MTEHISSTRHDFQSPAERSPVAIGVKPGRGTAVVLA